jgi:hypothetical protein
MCNDLGLPCLVINSRDPVLNIAAPAKQSSVHHNGNFPRCTTICGLHTAFNLPYVYDYITILAEDKLESYKIMGMNMFAAQEKAKPDKENIRGLNLVVVKLTITQETNLPL